MIALYPGAFKPPHRGHFNVVKSLLNGSYNGTVYNKDDAEEKGKALFQAKKVDKPKINQVVIFVGGSERNGIDKQEAIKIWEVYLEHLPNAIVVDGQKNPMFAAKDYARENPNEEFVAVTGIRALNDLPDLKRVTTFNNVDNVQGLALASAPGAGIRATDFRKNILAGNLDMILDFFPKELSRREILDILSGLKEKIVAEVLGTNISSFLGEYFTPPDNYKLKGITKSVDKQRLSYLYNYLANLIPSGTNINMTDNKIIVSFDDPITEQSRGPELKEYIASLLEYMLDQKMKITPLPEVKIRKDEANAANFFGKTAYYDPNKKEIVLYITGRHNKDIVRSFSHEMIHHKQNLEGTLHNIQTQNTNADSKLLDLEKEAYLLGNITFRNWEDSLKNTNEDVDGKKAFSREVQMSEGKYDKLSNQLSRIAFEFFKDVHDRGDKEGEFEFRVGNPEYDNVDIESTQFEFDFMGIVKYTDDTYKVDGGANAGFDDDGEEIQPMINVKFMIPRNPDWQEVSMDLKDVVRHELEHLTQDGENLRQGKYIPDDQDLRALIDKGLLDKDAYYTLPKEIDAMIQGLYFKAKKSKKPFSDVVDDYLKKVVKKLETRKKIRILWNKRLPALGIKQRL